MNDLRGGATVIRGQHRAGFRDLDDVWERLHGLDMEIRALAPHAPNFVQDTINRTLDRIVAFEPTISVIGQVKAGKSTLLNAMIGETSLLPSDVNPWTSVITGVHINSRNRPAKTRALFRFFDEAEWDRLVETGGRLGEMAQRSGFETEASEIRKQVMQMRRTTEDRLGEEFKELLGTSHAFPEIEKQIIDRYICFGDPEDSDTPEEGVYADLTKSADLYIDLPGYPKGLCLRDTPGVNDTFMMREQITLNAISESRVCLVVLSAHQALSTMDMALMRIICSVEAREVLIFVNRIDELSDPVNELQDIHTSINKTLRNAGVSTDVEVVFGSAYWANCALEGNWDNMSPGSRTALDRILAEAGIAAADPADMPQFLLSASGIEELHRAIVKRVIEGPGAAIMRDLETELENITRMIETVTGAVGRKPDHSAIPIDAEAVRTSMASIRKVAEDRFDASAMQTREALNGRLQKSQDAFIDSAMEALGSHLSAFGEKQGWSYGVTSLRMMMRTAFFSASAALKRDTGDCLGDALASYQSLMCDELAMQPEDVGMELPPSPRQKPPTALAKTLTLDLQSGGWRRFWRFGRSGRPDKRHEMLIRVETDPLVEELLTDYFDPSVAEHREVLSSFLDDQENFVNAVLDYADVETRPTAGSVTEVRENVA